MKKSLRTLAAVFVIAAFTLALVCTTTATMQHQKDTGKKCTDCHKTPLPKKGDKDPNLTDFGKKYQENGHKLPVEKAKG
jgi:hypothetical protein